jgi:hypothetical protein
VNHVRDGTAERTRGVSWIAALIGAAGLDYVEAGGAGGWEEGGDEGGGEEDEGGGDDWDETWDADVHHVGGGEAGEDEAAAGAGDDTCGGHDGAFGDYAGEDGARLGTGGEDDGCEAAEDEGVNASKFNVGKFVEVGSLSGAIPGVCGASAATNLNPQVLQGSADGLKLAREVASRVDFTCGELPSAARSGRCFTTRWYFW